MRYPENALLAINEILHVRDRAEMVDVSVGGIVLFECLIRGPRRGVREVHRLGQHHVPVAAKVDVDFFGRNHQEILVAHLARAFKIKLLLGKALGAGIG